MQPSELRAEMASRNITGQDLANRMNVSRRTIVRWRTDGEEIPTAEVQRLRAALEEPGRRYVLRRLALLAGFIAGAVLALVTRPEIAVAMGVLL